MEINGLGMHRGDGQPCRYEGRTPVWHDDQPIELFTIGAPAKVEITGPCIVKARFGFGVVHGLPMQPAVPILYQMGVMCEKIVNGMEGAIKSAP